MTDYIRHKKPEVLSPAGTYECFLAALNAGADAVYAGGPCFGARAFAGNFTESDLCKAIDKAHLHGKKFYLTVNTLIKDSEFDRLYRFLAPLYAYGLDAAIVQDIGVLKQIRESFPGLSVHVSTQATVTNIQGALFFREQGADRIVPARELSLEEVRDICEKTGMEVECFVHGALCYCYSGQCLLSSMTGKRSGNRGQCAQPCRLPYTVNGKKEYLMSLKDLCVIDLLPDLIEAGISSFKIEGRMKKPEYVALVTSIYRKYVNMYDECGWEGFHVSSRDKEKLMDIYNRGGFQEGYYRRHNGKNMISLDRPNHSGVPALNVISQKGREITAGVITEINKGDVIEFPKCQGVSEEKRAYTFGSPAKTGNAIRLLVPRGMSLTKGTVLNRVRNEELLAAIKDKIIEKPLQEPVKGILNVQSGKQASLTVSFGGASATAFTDEPADRVKKQPLDSDNLKKQLRKTGNSPFYFEALDILADSNAFLPYKQVNGLRRRALSDLEENICKQYRRTPTAFKPADIENDDENNQLPYISAVAETKEQLEALTALSAVKRVYADPIMCTDFLNDMWFYDMCSSCLNTGKEVFLAMPHIFRQNAITYFEKNTKRFMEFPIAGALIRNYESFYFLQKIGFDKKIILDHNLYVYNRQAKAFWRSVGIGDFTVPVELNSAEAEELGAGDSELVVYGRTPVMVSAQCIKKTTSGCDRIGGITWMRDRRGEKIPVRNCCGLCYNIIYNTEPTFLIDLNKTVLKIRPRGVRLHFTLEKSDEVRKLIKLCSDTYINGTAPKAADFSFTRGHFNRGVN